MARLKFPSRVPSVSVSALLVAVVLATTGPAIASKPEPRTTLTRSPPLLDCDTTPAGPPAAGETQFRANVLSLLRDIPSAAAAAPTGFATARSGTAGRDGAFARAFCFGGANMSSAAAARCRACLTAAARDATDGCGASRRAGVWRAGCFLGYSDTQDLSAREDAFRGWFRAGGPDSTAATTLEDRACWGDGTSSDCDRCIVDAARAAAAVPWTVRLRGDVIVVGYSCCVRVPTYALPIPLEDFRRLVLSFMVVMTMLAEMVFVAQVLYCIVRTVRDPDYFL